MRRGVDGRTELRDDGRERGAGDPRDDEYREYDCEGSVDQDDCTRLQQRSEDSGSAVCLINQLVSP